MRIGTTAGVLCLSAALGGCDRGEAAKSGSEKDAYATVAKIVKGPVGIIAAFAPHLEPKPHPGKYAVTRRPDFDRAVTFAGNGIRHAANAARQKLQAESSPAAAQLAESFVAVTKACADLQGLEESGKCKTAVLKLDAALQEAGAKASAAGSTEAVARVADTSIDEAAKKEIAPLMKAMGGGKEELAIYAKLEDATATSQALVDACQAAEEEGTANMQAVEKIDEEVRKVAAVHREMIKALCARVGRAEKARAELTACIEERAKKPLSKEREESCRLVCTAGKAAVEEGLPAAAFSKIPDLVHDLCDKESATKK